MIEGSWCLNILVYTLLHHYIYTFKHRSSGHKSDFLTTEYTHIHTHAHIHTHTCAYTHMCAYTHTCAYIHTHAHTHTHTHTHNLTTNIDFKALLNTLCPHYSLLNAGYFKNVGLPALYGVVYNAVYAAIQLPEWIAITTDCWTSKSTVGCIILYIYCGIICKISLIFYSYHFHWPLSYFCIWAKKCSVGFDFFAWTWSWSFVWKNQGSVDKFQYCWRSIVRWVVGGEVRVSSYVVYGWL